MVVQEDTVFVSGMDTNINEEEIADHFGSIGIIKVTIFSLRLNCTVAVLHSVLRLHNLFKFVLIFRKIVLGQIPIPDLYLL